jgi:hypothetical protein
MNVERVGAIVLALVVVVVIGLAVSAAAIFRSQMVSLAAEVDGYRTTVVELKAEIDTLKKQDTYALAEAGRILDSGDLKGAQKAYSAFVRDFPASPKVDNARTQLSAIEERLLAESRKAAAQAEQNRQKQEERQLAAKLQQGTLYLSQLIPILQGKTKNQVIDLLGPPDSVNNNGNELVYYDKAYSTTLRSNDTILLIRFSGGIIYSLGFNGEQQLTVEE